MLFILAATLPYFYSCFNDSDSSHTNDIQPIPTTPLISYEVLKLFPHDTSLFTEGFLMHDGKIFESSGSPDELPQCNSVVGITDLATGKFEQKIEINKSKYFGEGIAFLNNKLYQLTYKNQVGFIYNEKTFAKIDSFRYANKEGWSLTTNGKDLIMSDGTDVLTFLNPATLKPDKILRVTENGIPRDSLNELEFINGFIYANIWISKYIVKIDTTTGKVVGKLDLGSLIFDAINRNPRADVINGIAYDSTTSKIYVTGKLWANVYQINFSH
jgi:glutaminyl-peptide cyclotransferase